MPDVHRIGFTQLGSDSVGSDARRFNIVFVHGLGGHPRRTWEGSRAISNSAGRDVATTSSKRERFRSIFKSSSSKASSTQASTSKSDSATNAEPGPEVFWPDEFLTEDVPDARIWTYGYNADAISGLFAAQSKNSVSQHGRDFAVKIERDIENNDPIIFVAHSLGGIVVKDAIHRSPECAARTRLIIFLGTPHRGSSLAGWGEIASNLARFALQDSNKKIIETLEVNGEVLDNINGEFKIIADSSRIKIHSFQEAHGISGLKGLHNKVVDDFSSKMDLPRTIETVESIDANHMQMARCSDKADPQYRAICAVVKQFLRGGGGAISHHRTEETLPATISEPSGAPSKPTDSERKSSLPCYYLPFQANRRFTGREKALQDLKNLLFVQGSTKSVIVGLGGIGKTQTALQLAYWTKQHKPDYSIFWIPALSHATFEQAYVEIAGMLAIKKKDKDDDLKELVKTYLSSDDSGRWILVVDNADDQDVFFGNSTISKGIYDYLPVNRRGTTLVTTRYRDVASSFIDDESEMVALDDMSFHEGKTLLESLVTRKSLLSNDDAMRDLLETLTYLPLAITQASKYLNRNQVSIAEYLALLRGTEKDKINLISREFTDSTRYPDSQNAVATTWIVSFKQMQSSDPAAAELLSFVSLIEPKAIPVSLLPRSGREELASAIGTLLGYGFVSRRDDGLLDMHALVHMATRVWVQSSGLAAQTTETALRHTEKIFPEAEAEQANVWRAYLPHVFRMLEGSRGADVEERYDLCFDVGQCLLEDRRIPAAIKFLEEVCQRRQHRLSQEDPSRLTSEHELARAYLNNRQIKEAIKIFEHVVKVGKDTLREEDHSRLTSEHELARAYLNNRQIKKAIEIFEHVVKVGKDTLREEDHSRLTSEHELASAYLDNRQIKEAIKIFEHVVKVRKDTLREEDYSRLASEHELASAYLDNRQIKEAIKIFEHVVQVRKDTLRAEDNSRLASEHELARAYLDNRQIKEAIKIFEHVVQVQKDTLREEDHFRLTSEHELASAYLENRQVKEAIRIFEHVVKVRKNTLREEDHSRLTSEHELARAYKSDGRLEEAIQLYEHVVAIEGKTLDEGHPDRRLSQYALADAYLEDDRIEEAIKLLEHVVANDEMTLAPDDPDLLLSRKRLLDARQMRDQRLSLTTSDTEEE